MAEAVSPLEARRTRICGRPGSETRTECETGWEAIDRTLRLCNGKLGDRDGKDGRCFADFERGQHSDPLLEDLAAQAWVEACFSRAADVAEREFMTAAIIVEDRGKPGKLWLLSSPADGPVHALEFFSGERVADVRVEPSDPSVPGKHLVYSFTDSSERRYAAVRAVPSRVDADQPSVYAGWDGKGGTGHDVVLGATLFERDTTAGPDGVVKTVNRPVDPRTFFDGQPVCEGRAYVARTRASNVQDSEPGFAPQAKILADYDAAKGCWNTQPIHAVNLEDNTFLVATRTRVFRLSSKDLTPVGAAPQLRTVDIKE